MVNGEMICKTMLYNYYKLEDMCNEIDNKVLSIALHSANRDIFKTVNAINKLQNIKITYLNVKVVICDVLSKMKHKETIEMFYIKRYTIDEIANELNICYRSVQRRINNERKILYRVMLKLYGSQKLFEIIRNSEWLVKEYSNNVKLENKGSEYGQ